jgi:endonuclease/exonuclease/phosphatase family metal-dependent hydrolase
VTRIVTYNIRKGGLRRRRLIADVLQTVDADLVVLQEATDPRVVRFLADALGCEAIIHAPGRSVAVLGRRLPAEAQWHRMARARNFAEVTLPGLDIRILAVHLGAGLSGRPERRRLRQLDRVLTTACAAPGPGRTIILGDLNAVADGELPNVATLPRWIRMLLRVDGGMRTAVIDRVLSDGFVDAYRTLNPGADGSTMPAVAPTVRLDYVMVGPGLAPHVAACGIAAVEPALLRRASDHLPVVLDLVGPA